jgi:hypothetical protein
MNSKQLCCVLGLRIHVESPDNDLNLEYDKKKIIYFI